MEQLAKELIELRGETSKTYDFGGRKRRLITGGGIQHWKQDYSDKSEEWKECDLRWDGNRIEKAPYVLVRDGSKITFTDRKTRERTVLELVSSKCKDAKSISEVAPDFRIVPFKSGVHFQHYITADNLPFEASFKVEGKVPVSRAYDDIGELELEVSYDEKTGVLTERLTEIRAKGIGTSGELRQASGEIRIDPTLTIQPDRDEIVLVEGAPTTNHSTYANVAAKNVTGYSLITVFDFDMSSLPSGATIDTAKLELYLHLYSTSSASGRSVAVDRCRRYDWEEQQATWNIYKTGSNWGTAGCQNTSTDYDTTYRVTKTMPTSVGVWID